MKILKAEAVPGKRMQLARDVLALSFYLLAMNTADLFGDDAEIVEDRITYTAKRRPTRRKDEALMSVKVETGGAATDPQVSRPRQTTVVLVL